MLTRAQRKLVWGLMAALFLFSAVLSEVLRPGQAEYIRVATAGRLDYRDQEMKTSALRGTAFQTLLPTLLGIREVLASLMWVRADDYFHRGEYRPIIQMVRQITAIDPHQLDVYATGAWHMAYNFMDKRLIEDGVQFLEEGCKNNDAVYDLYFELGYMHYDKTKIFPEAVEAYQTASTRGTTQGKPTPPSYVRHQLAHAMEKMGDIDAAMKQWDVNLRLARELEREGNNPAQTAGPNTAAARHNVYITARRRNERLAAVAEREKNAEEAVRLWQENVKLAEEWLREQPNHGSVLKDLQTAKNNVDRIRGGRLAPLAPTDINLDFQIVRVGPKKLEISGTANVLNLSRVHVRIQDKDYATRASNFDFKMANCTLEWDNVSVNGGKFKRLIDLAKDPADMERNPEEIYPLKADEFEVSVTYNPRLQAAFIQDRYGWNGEGLTAQGDMLVIDNERAGVINGKRYPLRLVTKTVTITRDEILGSGKKQLYPRQ